MLGSEQRHIDPYLTLVAEDRFVAVAPRNCPAHDRKPFNLFRNAGLRGQKGCNIGEFAHGDHGDLARMPVDLLAKKSHASRQVKVARRKAIRP